MPIDSAGSNRRATTLARLSHIGLQLFFEQGFDETTVDDIAAAAGISRRTFFRYFPSKNDLPWGDFDSLVSSFRAYLATVPGEIHTTVALRSAIVEFNRYPNSELDRHRKRMQLLLNTPSLVAHSTLRYESWRAVVAEFVAGRTDTDPQDLQPRVMAWVYMAASIAAYEEWLQRPGSSLVDVIDAALADLERSFSTTTNTRTDDS